MLISKIKSQLSNQFIRNAGWMGGAELANRVFRLGTTVILARMFSPEDYGLMSIIYTTYAFANVFTLRGGISAKIIQADEKDVKAIAETSYWLNWILCVAIFFIQCIAAFPIAHFYHKQQLVPLICTAALTYLMLPLSMVNSAIIERENRLKITALCNVISSVISNSLTIIMVISGVGIWAIVWAMVAATLVWIVITWINHPWRPPYRFKLENSQEIINFGGNLLGVDLLNKVKENIDYLIVGRFLGIEALGIYYFAFNAGSGISMNVMNSFSSAMFPYLCEARGNIKQLEERFFSSLKKTCVIIVPLIILQASLAPFYVPLVFGEKWIPAIPILITICLSALPFPIGYAVFHLLNAVDKTRISLYWTLSQTVLFAIGILITVRWGIFGVAASVLVFQWLALIFYIWIIKYVFINK